MKALIERLEKSINEAEAALSEAKKHLATLKELAELPPSSRPSLTARVSWDRAEAVLSRLGLLGKYQDSPRLQRMVGRFIQGRPRSLAQIIRENKAA